VLLWRRLGRSKGSIFDKGTWFVSKGRGVGSYYYHKYHNHQGNVDNLFSSGICIVIDTTKKIIAIASRSEEELYERSIKVLYWDNGKKTVGYTNVKNIR